MLKRSEKFVLNVHSEQYKLQFHFLFSFLSSPLKFSAHKTVGFVTSKTEFIFLR
jgi:hypothetical protein